MPKISDHQRAERRRQILDGARATFARYGYERATVARLEHEIGLSRGAIFNYFPNKWAIFYALAEEDQERGIRLWMEQGFGAVLRQMADEAPDWLGVYFELIGMLRTNLDLRDEWANRTPGLNRQLIDQMQEMQRRGELRGDMSIDSLLTFLSLLLDGVVVAVAAGNPPDTRSLLKLVSAAISPQ